MRPSALLLVLLLGLGASARAEPPLETDVPVAGELAGGQARSFTLTLARDEALSVEAMQDGVDLVLAIEGAGGKLEVDSPNGTRGLESLFFVATAAGEHRISVRALEERAPAGRFTLRLLARRPATPLDHDRVAAQALLVEGYRLREEMRLREALPVAERAVALRERAHGRDALEVAAALTLRGYLHDEVAHYELGARDFARVLRIHEKQLGPDDPLTLVSRSNLAYLRLAEGNLAEAERLFRGLIGERTRLGLPAEDSVSGLADTQRVAGDLEAAEANYRKTLAAREAGREPNRMPAARIGLGVLLVERGHADEGEPLCTLALEALAKPRGFAQLTAIAARRCLAKARLARGDAAGALPLVRGALEASEAILGPAHPTVADALTILGRVHLAAGDLPAARTALRRALAIRQRAWRRPHPTLAAAYLAIADLETASGSTARARAARRRAAAIQRAAAEARLGT